jgi:hypothetical protein
VIFGSVDGEVKPTADEPNVFYMRNDQFEIEYSLFGKDFKVEKD